VCKCVWVCLGVSTECVSVSVHVCVSVCGCALVLVLSVCLCMSVCVCLGVSIGFSIMVLSILGQLAGVVLSYHVASGVVRLSGLAINKHLLPTEPSCWLQFKEKEGEEGGRRRKKEEEGGRRRKKEEGKICNSKINFRVWGASDRPPEIHAFEMCRGLTYTGRKN
jgi:hypothetical protein